MGLGRHDVSLGLSTRVAWSDLVMVHSHPLAGAWDYLISLIGMVVQLKTAETARSF
jgi:hypothetical protein